MLNLFPLLHIPTLHLPSRCRLHLQTLYLVYGLPLQKDERAAWEPFEQWNIQIHLPLTPISAKSRLSLHTSFSLSLSLSHSESQGNCEVLTQYNCFRKLNIFIHKRQLQWPDMTWHDLTWLAIFSSQKLETAECQPQTKLSVSSLADIRKAQRRSTAQHS